MSRPAKVLLSVLLTSALLISLQQVSAYSPKAGDSFSYSETIIVNNGQGSYTGYNDQTQITGSEQMDSVSGSNVSAHYSYSYQFSNNQGSSTSSSSSGSYTWSTSSYTYLNGTDNQVGYSRPIYVWFAMNPSLSVGSKFYVLNTQFTVISKNISLKLPTEGNQFFQTIEASGTGQYQRHDDYGVFTASYTWTEYLDPATGYIVGYHYVEQDNGQYQGQDGSFTYTDDLYVTSTSYGLTPGVPVPTNPWTGLGDVVGQYGFPIFVLLVLIALVATRVVRMTRRRKTLPEHSPPPTSTDRPWESNLDLGSKPPQQVVIRDVAKVNCKYCGTLIPTTVDHCPYCGGPRQ